MTEQEFVDKAPAAAELDQAKTKSIFSVVREDDSIFAHNAPPYDGKDELN